MKRNIKKMALAAMLAGMLGGLTGCFIQPDPTLDPLQISDGTVPFGTVQALPTNTPTPVPQNTPTPTPDTWQSSDQSTWEDWSGGSLPTTTPKTAATVAPGAQSWQTSTQDYNAGGRVLGVVAVADTLPDALKLAYRRVENIRFENAYYRHDIGRRACAHDMPVGEGK